MQHGRVWLKTCFAHGLEWKVHGLNICTIDVIFTLVVALDLGGDLWT
jgi:hypothetical protein